jgi:hypothetical protein
MAYSEAKAARSKAARAEVASFPRFASRIAGRVLPAHVRSVYMAAANGVDAIAPPLDADVGVSALNAA